MDAHQLFLFCFFPGNRDLLRLRILPGPLQNMVISSRGEKRKKEVVAFGRPGRQRGSGASCWRCSGVRITRWTSSCSGNRTVGTLTSCLRPCSVSTSEPSLPLWPFSLPQLSPFWEGPSAVHTLTQAYSELVVWVREALGKNI